MRRLEDGTYMFDEDTRWDRIFPLIFFGLVCFGLLILWSHLAISQYKAEGLNSFYYVTDKGTGYICGIMAALIWMVIFLKTAFRQWKESLPKDLSND